MGSTQKPVVNGTNMFTWLLLSIVWASAQGILMFGSVGMALKPDSLLVKHVLHLLLTCDHDAALTLVAFSFRVELAG